MGEKANNFPFQRGGLLGSPPPGASHRLNRSSSVGSTAYLLGVPLAEGTSGTLATERGAGKRTRMDVERMDAESEAESESVDDLTRLREVGDRLRRFIFLESSKVSKNASEFILGRTAEMEDVLLRVMLENERLRGRLDARAGHESCMKEQSARVSEKRTEWTTVTRKNNKKKNNVGVRETVAMTERVRGPRSYAVVVRTAGSEAEDADSIKRKLLGGMKVPVRVKGVQKLRDGGLRVKTVSEVERATLETHPKLQELGLRVKPPRKLGPKVVLYHVPSELSEEQLMKEMYERNLKDVASEDDFGARVRVLRRIKDGNSEKGNVVIEVSDLMKRMLRKQGRVYVGWMAYKVRELAYLNRWFGCYGFGHMAKNYPLGGRLCKRCGGKGYLAGACKGNESCRLCSAKGQPSGHSVLAKECPEFKREAMRMRKRYE